MKNLVFRGKPLGEKASQVCVLYDPKDGRIVHVHGATAAREELCLDQSSTRGKNHPKRKSNWSLSCRIENLHVPLSAIQQRGVLKVDEKRETLVVSSAFPSSLRDLAASGQPKKRKVAVKPKAAK